MPRSAGHLHVSPLTFFALKLNRHERLIMKTLLVVISMFLLVGCASPLKLVTSQSTIEGKSVARTAIRVNQPFTFRPAMYSATYPPGLYLPKFEDDEGIFFKAPDQLLAETIIGGRTMQGGLYVSKQSWSRFKAYIDELGQIYKFDIPVPLDFTIVNQP